MKNKSRVLGQMMSAVVRRIKASGLPQAMIDRAITAAKGTHTPQGFRLTVPIRKQLFDLVKKHGPLVVTGRKALKIFTLDGYNRARAQASINAKAHTPWKHAHKNPQKKYTLKIKKQAVIQELPVLTA